MALGWLQKKNWNWHIEVLAVPVMDGTPLNCLKAAPCGEGTDRLIVLLGRRRTKSREGGASLAHVWGTRMFDSLHRRTRQSRECR